MDEDPDSPAAGDDVLVLSDDPLAGAAIAQRLAAPGAVLPRVVSRGDLRALALPASRGVLVHDLGPDARAVPDRLAASGATGFAVLALLPDAAHAGEVLAAGARGVLRRDAGGAVLRAAVAALAQGVVVLDPAVAAALLPTRGQGTRRSPPDLTARELEVLQALADGQPNRAIAVRLGISEHTVKFHVNSVLAKLDVQSRTEAVVHAARLGLVLL